MWRLVFLILVVLGALAALLAVILGAGVARIAMIQTDGGAQVVPSTSQPATATSTPKTPAIPPATPATQSVAPLAPVPPAVPAPVRPGIAEAPAVIPPANFVPGTIVLRASDAKIHGKLLRKTPPEGDLTSWTRPEDFPTWVFTPPRGRYRVVITRANGANSGGDFALAMSDSKKADPMFIARAAPTGGWDVFRTEFVGILELDEKRTTIALRPAGDLNSALMRLRKIELIPVDPAVALKPDDPNNDGPPEVTGLTIVEAATGKPLGMLTSSMVLDLSALPPISLRAETAGVVRSVRFSVNKSDRVESERPFSVAGERGPGYIPWTPEAGKQSIVVTPFGEPGGGGKAGKKLVAYVKVISAAAIVLSAKNAVLHGGTVKLQGGDEPMITSWSQSQDWIEWSVDVPISGTYEVELHYSAAKGHGGDFVMRVGNSKIGDDVGSTGAWETYDRLRVGEVKLSRGKTQITMRPNDLDEGKMLMNLREVRLVPLVDEDD